MRQTINTRVLPSIGSYEEAKAYFEKTKPKRGADWVPLGRRGDSSKRMENRYGEYRCIFHQTAVVIYGPQEIRVKPYDSVSTVMFANCFLPAFSYALSHHGRMWVASKTDGDTHYFDNDVRFVKEPDGSWRTEATRKHRTNKVLDKVKAAEVRARLKSFLLWQAATAKINPGSMNRWPSQYDMRGLFADPENVHLYSQVGHINPNKLRLEAYAHFGAYCEVEVPLNKLPKKDPI